jgi:Flp pilus assembly protein TadD
MSRLVWFSEGIALGKKSFGQRVPRWYNIGVNNVGHPRFLLSRLGRLSVPRASQSHNPFIIRTYKAPLQQPVYHPHVQAYLGCVGNKGLVTPLESALTKNGGLGLVWRACLSSILFFLLIACLAPAQAPPDGHKLPAASVASQQAEVESSSKTEAPLVEARSLLQKGMVQDADRTVRQYLSAHANSAEGHFLLGTILFREIQANAGVKVTAGGVNELMPSGSDENFRAAKAKESLAEFTEGAKYRAPTAADLKVVAFDYVLLGDYVDADKWLTKMLEWAPNDSDGWYHLGRTKYNENRFAEAISAFQQCLKLDPKNVKAEDNLGLSFAGLGRNDEAAAAYQQAIAWQAQSTAKNPGPYIDMGSLLIDEDRLEDSVPFLLQAAEIARGDSRAHELLGKAYTRLEELPKAQAELEKAIELSPQTPNLHCMLAPVYRKQGLAEKAKIEFDHCAAMTGSHSTPETPRP